jgi:hypothetical protein
VGGGDQKKGPPRFRAFFAVAAALLKTAQDADHVRNLSESTGHLNEKDIHQKILKFLKQAPFWF